MLSITKVCNKCDNNRFVVRQQGPKFDIVCSKCSSLAEVVQLDSQMVLSKCGKCNCEIYRVQQEMKDDGGRKYNFSCSQCESPAEYFLIDDDGNKITKEQKELLDIKKLIGSLIKKVSVFETGIEELRGSISNLDLQHEEVTAKVDNMYEEVNDIKTDMNSIESQLGNLKINIAE